MTCTGLGVFYDGLDVKVINYINIGKRVYIIYSGIHTILPMYYAHVLCPCIMPTAGRRLVGGPTPLVGGPTSLLKIHVRCRNLLIHVEKFAPEPLHVFIGKFFLFVKKIIDGHLSE